jgi:tetratricopeptide (TPR) repeat protein
VIKNNKHELHEPQLDFFYQFLVDDLGATKIPRKLIQEVPQTKVDDKLENKYLDEMGDGTNQTSEEKAQEFRSLGIKAMEEKDYKRAAIRYGQAIHASGGKSSLLFIRRAEAMYAMDKSLSARRDCDHAIKLNPDAGKAYLIRGLVNKKLRKFTEAKKDLLQAMSIDASSEAQEALKQLENEMESKPSEAIPMTNRSQPNMPSKALSQSSQYVGWMTPQIFDKVAKDSELMQAFSNPKIMNAIQEVSQKYGSADH